ncbi:PAS domain-containing protein [Roseovarius sp. SCSIO 43702]|uniref:sensor histidine kinase n=1 Tax=Roseovarius sp. SCSIO 43702 TaxID=2823043 RepID=UPI001C72CBE3|nr:PAS domain-containing protein [Roseovarius sp. SCSIO 43702]QYX58399.1 PAS domain-containing protein [Roseovarius sp. SCSIO 43702]
MRDDDNDVSATPEGLPRAVSAQALRRAPFAIVITNPTLDDNPIVYVNRAFEEMTGYSSQGVIGRNCRFLQRDDRDQKALDRLRDAIAEKKEATVTLRNYRADGTPFLNRLMVAPLRTEPGETPFFLGVQTVVKDSERGELLEMLEEIQHRVKNHLSMIVGMIRMQARGAEDGAGHDFSTLARRVKTLQLLYEELNASSSNASDDSQPVALGAYLTRVANAIAHIDGRSGVRVNLDADALTVPMQAATQLGLILSEVMTNAMQHAFDDRDSGLVDVRIKELSKGVLRLQVADDGTGMPEDVEWPGDGNLGGRIVTQLVTGLDAQLSVERQITGTTVTIDIPSSSLR